MQSYSFYPNYANFFAMFVIVVVYIVWKRQSTIMESEMRLRLRSTPVTLTMTC